MALTPLPSACLRLPQREPSNAALLGAYAVFLWDVYGESASAEALFEAAAHLAPQNLDVLGSRAYFAMMRHT